MKFKISGILLVAVLLSTYAVGYASNGPTIKPPSGQKAADVNTDYAITSISDDMPVSGLIAQAVVPTDTQLAPADGPAPVLASPIAVSASPPDTVKAKKNALLDVANQLNINIDTSATVPDLIKRVVDAKQFVPSKGSSPGDWVKFVLLCLGIIGTGLYIYEKKKGVNLSIVILMLSIGICSSGCSGTKTLFTELKAHCKYSGTGNAYNSTGTYCLTCDSLSQVIPKKLSALPSQ
jgi:hypothetical protein